MKKLIFLLLLANGVFAQSEKDSIMIQLNHKELKSLKSIKTGTTVFVTDIQKTATWTGSTWEYSIASICQDCCVDCGGGGGGGSGTTPAPVITASVTAICSAQISGNVSNPRTTTITATGCNATGIMWFIDGNTTNFNQNTLSINLSPTSTTTYYATCSTAAGGQSVPSNKITVTVNSTPVTSPTVTVSESTILLGNSVSLSATGCGAMAYKWFNPATVTLETNQNITKSPAVNMQYSAYCSSNECLSQPTQKIITVIQPILSSTSTQICFDANSDNTNSINLTVSNCSGSVQWSNGQTTTTITVSSQISTSFSATCTTSANQVVTVGTINLTTISQPSITKTYVAANSLSPAHYLLTASGCIGTSVLWSNGFTTNSISVPIDVYTSYSAQCNSNGCYSQRKTITIIPPNTISSNTSLICKGQTLILNSTECSGTVTWYGNSNLNTTFGTFATGTTIPLVIPNTRELTSIGIYATCTERTITSAPSNVLSITVLSGTKPVNNPSVTTNPMPAVINLGGSITMTASGCATGETVVWSTGDIGSSLTDSPIASTSYYSFCYNNTCLSNMGTNTGVMVVNVLPPIISSSDNLICEGSTISLTASRCNGSVNWYSLSADDPFGTPTLLGSGTNPFTTTVLNSTIYRAKCADLGVVSDFSNTVLVNIIKKPTITSDLQRNNMYSDESMNLTANCGNYGVVWNTGSTNSTINVSPPASPTPTTYTAFCTNGSCQTIGTTFNVKVCPATVVYSALSNFPTMPAKVIISSEMLFANNTYTEYEAKSTIVLQPGFRADSGKKFLAFIGGCH